MRMHWKPALAALIVASAALWTFRPADAGQLSPPGPPSPTMHTLDEIYANTRGPLQPPQARTGGCTRAYLNIPGITGDAEQEYAGWIPIYSFDYTQLARLREVQPGQSPRLERVVFSEITLVKDFDRNSPQMGLDAGRGRHYGAMTVDFVQSTGQNLTMSYRIEMTDVMITSIRPHMVPRNTDYALAEEITFLAQAYKWTCRVLDTQGQVVETVVHNWDQASNSGE